MTTDDFNTYNWYENESNEDNHEENTKDTEQLKIYHIGVYSKLTGKRMLLFKVHAFNYADAIETIKDSKYGDLIFSDDDVEIREISEKKYQGVANKRLYEKIMRKIANSVKRILNEEVLNFNSVDYQEDDTDMVNHNTIRGLCKDEHERLEWQSKVKKLIRRLDKLEKFEDIKGSAKRHIGKEMGYLGVIRKLYIKDKIKYNNEFQKLLYNIKKLLDTDFNETDCEYNQSKCCICIATYPDYSRRGEHIWFILFINLAKHELISICDFPTEFNGNIFYTGVQFRDDYEPDERKFGLDMNQVEYWYEFPMSCWDLLVEKLT